MLIKNEVGIKGVSKVDLYGWGIADQPGELLWIDKNLLQVDLAYQREAQDGAAKVKSIASEWSWIACGALTVAKREENLFVIDGHHRARAAMKRSDIKNLPCVVFESAGAKDEAEGFLRANRNRRAMSAIDAFKAQIASGNGDAIFLNDLVKTHGLKVGPHSSNTFSAPGVMMRLISEDRARAEMVFRLTYEICAGAYLHSDILQGLFLLEARLENASLRDARLRVKLIEEGRDTILKKIAEAKVFRGASGDKVRAEGILNALNLRLRNKITARL